MPVHGGAFPPALVQELPGEAILSRKRQGGQHTITLHALKLRCAHNCVAACRLQGYADAKPRADIILTVCGPVWKAYGYDYKYLNEPKQVKLKYTKAALSGYDAEVRKVFCVMKDEDFIGRSLSSHEAVDTVPNTAYTTLRSTLQKLHENDDSAPDGGAQSPAAAASVEIEFHPFQIFTKRREEFPDQPSFQQFSKLFRFFHQ